MGFLPSLKLFFYKFRSNLFEPPKFKDAKKSESLTIVTEEGATHELCHFDYKRQRWICPFEDLCFTRDKISYWKRPMREKIFCYIDEEEDEWSPHWMRPLWALLLDARRNFVLYLYRLRLSKPSKIHGLFYQFLQILALVRRDVPQIWYSFRDSYCPLGLRLWIYHKECSKNKARKKKLK